MRDADVIGDADSLGKNAYEVIQKKPREEIEEAKRNLAEKNRHLMEIVTSLKSTQNKIVYS
jgi:thiamine pyrophosphokinase